ncbi:MAG: protein kinase [Planctomycetaceae bacterium]
MSEVALIDDYELVNCVATGNSTQVWEVLQRSSGQTFAMKLMLPQGFRDPEQKKALKHEYSVAKSLEHPNIIQMFDLVMTKEHAYFIMEYFRSTNLKQLYRSDIATAQARLPKMIEALAQALAHMHEKTWVHKDIKPDNILLTKGGEFRLIDFSLSAHPVGGLGRIFSTKSGTTIQGTRTYLAPELIRRQPLTVSADIYSLGVTMYEVLVGRPPFVSSNPNDLLMMHVRDKPEDPTTFNPNVSPEANAFALRLLAKDPKNRPATMQEVYSEVRTLRFFKEDPMEFAANASEKSNAAFLESVSARLDSRTDATRDRSEALPVKAAAPKKSRLALAQEAKAAREKGTTASGETSASPAGTVQPAAPPVTQNPAVVPPGYPPQYAPLQGQMPPGYPPGYGAAPGMPWGYPPGAAPQYPMTPQGYPPGMIPPGYQYPPQGYPSTPGTQMPGYPQDPGPPAPYPPGQQYPFPPGQVPPGQVTQGAPAPSATPTPPAGATPPTAIPTPPANAPKKKEEEDIPMMTELPDVF